jgi:hypothetical protein
MRDLNHGEKKALVNQLRRDSSKILLMLILCTRAFCILEYSLYVFEMHAYINIT